MFVLITALFTESNHVLAASPKLNQTSATLWIGDTLQLKVKNTKKKVKWSSGKKSVATVSAKGKIKAKKAGKTVITAKIGNKKYKCRVSVRKTQLSSKEITLDYGKSVSLTLKYPKKKVAWFSSDKQVAYADGKCVYAKSVGEAVITAKCNGKSYSCKVKVLSGETEKLVENGIYTSKEKVALYIHTYQKLPDNFLTKNEAKKLGWDGGSLLSCAPYKCIGGDVYSNYENTLPVAKGRIYYECDIDTLGALTRGAERLIYSNDGLIYYTSDHYTTFTKLYE
jgi:uncharacterized protein YjdB